MEENIFQKLMEQAINNWIAQSGNAHSGMGPFLSIGRVINVHDSATYIEKDQSTRSGGNEEGLKEDEVECVSELEHALRAVADMALQGFFKPQQNYIAAYRVVEENYAPGLKTAEFCRMMEKKTSLPPELLPRNENIRKIYYERRCKYPDWSFPTKGIEWTQTMVDIARDLLKRINEKG